VGVDVTERRFVRHVRGDHPGLVTYRNERTVWVAGTTNLEPYTYGSRNDPGAGQPRSTSGR
jgi:predicted ribosome quality control (RQC) complex YloA/Tae2 family protein